MTRLIRQTPLQRLEISISRLSHTHKPDLPATLRALDPKANIDSSMQLVQLPTDPWYSALKIYLVAQDFADGG